MPSNKLEFELMSSTAAAIAGLTALPITELKVKRAPMFTDFGLENEDGILESFATPFPKLGSTSTIQQMKINKTPVNRTCQSVSFLLVKK